MPARRGLNERQDKFAKNYALGMNAVDAALAAGYSQKNATQNSSKFLVRLDIQQAVDQYKRDLGIAAQEEKTTPEYVMRQARKISDLHIEDNPSAAVAALRLQADVLGMLQGGNRDVPEAARQLMEAIGAGAAREMNRRKLDASEAREVRQLPTGHTE